MQSSHINYANVIWAQNFNAVNRVSILEKKATRTISLLARDYHSSPLFKKQNLLKACVQFFIKFSFSPNGSPSKTMKNVFYFS